VEFSVFPVQFSDMSQHFLAFLMLLIVHALLPREGISWEAFPHLAHTQSGDRDDGET
jgi:hypothetical protein